MPELVRQQHEAFYSLMHEVDVVVTLSEWSRNVLIRNGIAESKITRLHHWLPSARDAQSSSIDVASVPLKVAFLGRAVRIKGADTLIKAVLEIPDVQIEVGLYGVAQDAHDEGYWAELKALAARDPRITFLPSIANDKIISLLKGYHVLAMPARGVENRPLVLLESIAAGTPILGSDLGGTAELVCHMKDGLLVEPENVSGWANALRLCAEDRDLLSRLRDGVRMPRRKSDVAQEMASLYFSYVKRPAVVHSDYEQTQ
jgi:glycosyltransferase involved in cell wall biosynthesis